MATDLGIYGATPMAPEQRLQQQFSQLHNDLRDQWKIELNVLQHTQFKDQPAADAALAKLNAKYQMMELNARKKLEAYHQDQERKRQLIASPKVPITGVSAASAREVAESRKRLSPQQLESPSLAESIGQYVENLPDKSVDNLLTGYMGWKEFIGYDTYNPVIRGQLDRAWDMYMRANNYSEWKRAKGALRMVRSAGTGARAMKQRALGSSPLAWAIAKKTGVRNMPVFRGWGSSNIALANLPATPRQAVTTGPKLLDRETAKRLLDEAGGDKNKARELAKQRGYRF